MYPKKKDEKWWQELSSEWKNVIKISLQESEMPFDDLDQLPNGVEEFPYLHIWNDKIDTFDPVNDLHNLVKVSLQKIRRVHSLSAFANLNKMRSFGVGDSAIFDIEPIIHLPNIEELHIGRTAIKDYSGINYMPVLKRLAVPFIRSLKVFEGNAKIEILNTFSIRTISKLPNLKKLEYMGETFPVIKDCPSIEELRITHPHYTRKDINFKNLKPMPTVRKISFFSKRTLSWLNEESFPNLETFACCDYSLFDSVPVPLQSVRYVYIDEQPLYLKEETKEKIKRYFPNAELKFQKRIYIPIWKRSLPIK